MRIVVKMSETLEDGSVSIKKRKKDKKERWKWDEQKSERVREVFKSFKRQKRDEGMEWDSDKVVLFEHARKALSEEWPEDFGKSEPATPEKPVEDMSKEEYQQHIENLKIEKELIALGYLVSPSSMKKIHMRKATI